MRLVPETTTPPTPIAARGTSAARTRQSQRASGNRCADDTLNGPRLGSASVVDGCGGCAEVQFLSATLSRTHGEGAVALAVEDVLCDAEEINGEGQSMSINTDTLCAQTPDHLARWWAPGAGESAKWPWECCSTGGGEGGVLLKKLTCTCSSWPPRRTAAERKLRTGAERTTAATRENCGPRAAEKEGLA